MVETNEPHVIEPGDVGVLIRANGTVDILVPQAEEGKPLGSIGRALVGAAVSILSDPETQEMLEQRFILHMLVNSKPAPGGRSGPPPIPMAVQ